MSVGSFIVEKEAEFKPLTTSHRQFSIGNIFKVSKHHTIIKIPYLDQDADYIDQFGREFSGAELVHSSIHIPFAASDFQTYSLQLSRTQSTSY
ncbi:TPA: hypothetical protein U1617_000697 [Streptococcus suis]|nr:hypothetical protein [Streptococcus suis]HEM5490161.1 hypothetical protein [Streptococcus suis]